MKMTNSTIQIRLTNSAGEVTEKEYQFDADDTGENAFFAAYIAVEDGFAPSILDCDCLDRSWYGMEHDEACPCEGVR
jgi:hypothetical protein